MPEFRFEESCPRNRPDSTKVDRPDPVVASLTVDDCHADVYVSISHEGTDFGNALELILTPEQAREAAKAFIANAEAAEQNRIQGEK